MSKINILSERMSQLIAAGEVVERPQSVIKELIENSIDSGADKITIEIKNGGNTFMRVTDNGCGIEKEDVSKAFLPHATSKIEKESDLDSIFTLGFRGEALASIAAVSKVTVITKTNGSVFGTIYKIEGSNQTYIDETGCADGTTFIVEDLFYNTPARMKFLKKDISEANAIASVVDKLALSHPDVEFSFIRDGKETLSTVGDGNLKRTIYCVYGKSFTDDLVSVDYELNGIKVKGYICKPIKARPNRSMQHFFVNNRYVKSKTAAVAIEQAYKNCILNGKFPSCVLNINLACNAVDVNVHPTKTEVRFVNEKPIFDAIYYAVKAALDNANDELKLKINQINLEKTLNKEKNEKPKLEPNLKEKPEIFIPTVHKYTREKEKNVTVPDESVKPFSAIAQDNNFSLEDNTDKFMIKNFFATRNKDKYIYSDYEKENLNITDEKIEKESVFKILESEKIIKTEFIGELFKTYIIAQRENEILFIDKHAAHERLIYNNFKKNGANGFSQCLLTPMKVVISKDEYSAAIENVDRLSECGFEIDDFGKGTIIIRSAPMVLKGEKIKEAFIEIVGYILDNKIDINTKQMDWIYKSIACKAAIKAGDENTKAELVKLLSDLDKSPDVKYCPHGRPISLVMTKKEIEKHFKRT